MGKVVYEKHTEVTKELLDSIKIGDKIKVNDWKRPMTVKGVTANYFVMTSKEFGEPAYSVCQKIEGDITHNQAIKGMFHVGPDYWIFGWHSKDFDWKYDFESQEQTLAYLQSFELDHPNEHRSEISLRNCIPIREIQISRSKP